MRRWRERGTLGEQERVGMGTTMATGEAKLTADIVPDAVVRSARESTGQEGADLMEAIGPRSQIVVPLRARGRVLGALSLTMAESGRHYGEADLDLVARPRPARRARRRQRAAVRGGAGVRGRRAAPRGAARRALDRVARDPPHAPARAAPADDRRPRALADRHAAARSWRSCPGAATAMSAISEATTAPDPGAESLSAPLVARDGTRLRRDRGRRQRLEGDFDAGRRS